MEYRILNTEKELKNINRSTLKRFTYRKQILAPPNGEGYHFATPDAPSSWGLWGMLLPTPEAVVLNRLGAYLIHRNHRYLEDIPQFFFDLNITRPDIFLQLNKTAYPNNGYLEEIKDEVIFRKISDVRADSLVSGDIFYIGDDIITRKEILLTNFRQAAFKLAPIFLEENGIDHYLDYYKGAGLLVEDLLSKVIKLNPIFFIRRYLTHYNFSQSVIESFYTEIFTGRAIKFVYFHTDNN